MGAVAVFHMFIIAKVVYSCIPTREPTKTTTIPAKTCSGLPTNATFTEDGLNCVFPFIDGGEERTECMDYKGSYTWCATSLKDDCSFDKWGKCAKQKETTKKPDFKDCVTVDLNPGQPCVFPFTYQYHDHFECLPFRDKTWCALTSVYDKKKWGYCDQSLCPPTAEPGSCGNNVQIDKSRLLAEHNFLFIMEQLDNHKDVTEQFKTKIVETLSFDKLTGKFVYKPSFLELNAANDAPTENQVDGELVIEIKLDSIEEDKEFFKISLISINQRNTFEVQEAECTIDTNGFTHIELDPAIHTGLPFADMAKGAVFMSPFTYWHNSKKYGDGSIGSEICKPGCPLVNRIKYFCLSVGDNTNTYTIIEFKQLKRKLKTENYATSPGNKYEYSLIVDRDTDEFIYLPWMKNSITFTKLDNSDKMAFTAQLSGCGVHLFKIKNKDNDVYGYFMSHQNGISASLLICPATDWIKGEIASLITTLYPEYKGQELLKVAEITKGNDYQTELNLNFPLESSNIKKCSRLISKGFVFAIKDPRQQASTEFCLMLQRSVIIIHGIKYVRNFARKIGGEPAVLLKCGDGVYNAAKFPGAENIYMDLQATKKEIADWLMFVSCNNKLQMIEI